MSKRDRYMEPEEMMAYLDGELSVDRAAMAAEHLAECSECQSLAADLRDVSRAMMAWEVEAPEIEVPLEFAVDVQRNKPRAQAVRSGRPVWRRIFALRTLMWAGAVGVTAVLLFAISMPSLLRNKTAADRVSALARQRVEESRLQPYIRNPESTNGTLGGLSVNGTPPQIQLPDSADKIQTADNSFTVGLSGNESSLTSNSGGATYAYGNLSKLQQANPAFRNGSQTESAAHKTPTTGPMIIRTAQLSLSTKDFERTRTGVEEVLKRHSGYIGQLNVTAPVGGARTLNATLRVPATQLDATLAEMKSLGKVVGESQGGEEVTQRYIDLEARLANARNSEVRLTQILQRAGKLSDVLAVEEQIENVRGEIEQMTAEKKTLSNQIDFATLTATVAEEFKEQLQVVPDSTSTRFRNAAVEGYRTMVDGIVGLLLFLVSVGPSLLLWIAVLFFPVRWAWRKLRKKMAEAKVEPAME